MSSVRKGAGSWQRRGPWVYMCALMGIAILSAVITRGEHASAKPAIVVTTNSAVPSLAGSWMGTWTDTIFSVGGDLSFDIAQDGADFTATGTIDLSALGIGSQMGTASGTLTQDTLSFSFNAAMVGNGVGTVSGSGGLGSGTVTAPLDFGAFTFSGTVSDVAMNGIFDFTSPTGGAGQASLSKATAIKATPWGKVKKQYDAR